MKKGKIIMKRLLIVSIISFVFLSSCYNNIHRIPTQTYSDMFGNKIHFNGDTIVYDGEEICVIKYDKCNGTISFKYNRYIDTIEFIYSINNKDSNKFAFSYNANEPKLYRVDREGLTEIKE